MTARERTFVLAYLANGLNATAAYLAAHPRVVRTSASTLGSQLSREPRVAAAIAEEQAQRWRALHMTADEVLARLAVFARHDERRLFDNTGHLQPVHDLPDDVAARIVSVKVLQESTTRERVDGETEEETTERLVQVKVADPLRATELLAKHHRLISDRVDHEVGPSLAELLEGMAKPA